MVLFAEYSLARFFVCVIVGIVISAILFRVRRGKWPFSG
jgi:hypothetical protein